MAVILPYRHPPGEAPVAVLVDDGRAFTGRRLLELDQAPANLRIYAGWSTVARLLRAGRGEAMLWGGDPVRWRGRRLNQDRWQPRAGDVTVLKLEPPTDERKALRGFREWARWLESYGAVPQRSLGYSGFGLLRATLREPVYTMAGEAPPLSWTQGARQQLLAEPRSEHLEVMHLDLPAAYPRAMGPLPVGGLKWRHLERRELVRVPLESRAVSALLFVYGRVTVPGDLEAGPLPQRPLEAPVGSWERCEILGGDEVARYPVGESFTGIWCWQELGPAVAAGVRLEPEAGWLGVGSGSRPFLPWLEAVEDGRERLRGFAGQLVKSSANATWGQLVIRPDNRRTLAWFERGVLQQRRLEAMPGGLPPSWDVGELIAGTVRGRLASMMRELAGEVISVHTDGGWVRELERERVPAGWIVKDRADVLQIVDPQFLRYRRRLSPKWLYRVAGSPPSQAPQTFEQAWLADRPELLSSRKG